MPTYRTRNAGFTLIEMAIILVVIGILTGLGAGMISPMIKRIKTNETKDTLAAAAEGVVSYAALHKEIPTLAEIPSVARTMGDSWKKDLLYVPDGLLTTPDICGRSSTGLSVIQCGADPACTTPRIVQNAAFVLASGGENMNIQLGTGAFAGCPAGKTCIRVWDTGTPDLDGYSADMSRNESFDDLVTWITLDELRIKAGCVGPALRIVNNELPFGSEGNSYMAEVIADGGVPFETTDGNEYKWCVQWSVQGDVPDGLSLTPNATSSDCAHADEGTAAWGQAKSLVIQGTPAAGTSSTYPVRIFVRDNNDPSGENDNIASKNFVITINPAGSNPGSCQPQMCPQGIRVWNFTRFTADFLFNNGHCRDDIGHNREITTDSMRLNSGGSIQQFSRLGTCNFQPRTTITYSQAASADADGDCQVSFTATGVRDR
ncbi:MAG: prepilin-type N-terminal cleavage/methylation domain-containing protein [Deltaproteobacteria bacterium]